MIRDQNVANKAAVGYLEPRKEVANCRWRFSGFKTKSTVHRLNLKVKNNKKGTKKFFRGHQAKSKLRVTYFEYKMQQTIGAW